VPAAQVPARGGGSVGLVVFHVVPHALMMRNASVMYSASTLPLKRLG
jgi:hypothetical protein